MIFDIPGRKTITIDHVVLDFNGTIAVDGKLIDGVAAAINDLAARVTVHVLTADTFGSVEKALGGVACRLVVIPNAGQDTAKRDYLLDLGKDTALAVGNGRNDALMLKAAAVGIAVIQDEGASVDTLLAADVVCKSILDVFAYFGSSGRLVATLRN
jgi:soluble P-type ATPase